MRVKELDTLLRRIREEHGVTIVMIEHVVNLVMGVCDFVTVMNSGKPITEGTPMWLRAIRKSSKPTSGPANAERRACERVVRRYTGTTPTSLKDPGQAGDRIARRQWRRQVHHSRHVEWIAEAAQRHRYA